MKERHYELDFIKVCMTLCVVIGHTYCAMLRIEGEQSVIMQNVAVDVFFMISGLFIGRYFDLGKNNQSKYLRYIYLRFMRLAPMYYLASFLWGVYRLINGTGLQLHEYWFQILLLGSINSFNGNGIEWYVSLLFWVGIVYAGLLSWNKKRSVVFVIPCIMWIIASIMHSTWGSLSLNGGGELWKNSISPGMFKAFLALGGGIELYYFITYVIKKFTFKKILTKKMICIFVELISTIGLAYCFSRNEVGSTDWLVYLFFPMLVAVIWTDNSIIYNVVDNKVWSYIGKYTYAIYLSHMFVVTLFSKFFVQYNSDIFIYGSVVVVSVMFGMMFYYVEFWIRRGLKLFVERNLTVD